MIIRNEVDLEGHMIGKMMLEINGIKRHYKLTRRINNSYGRQQHDVLHEENLEYFQKKHFSWNLS